MFNANFKVFKLIVFLYTYYFFTCNIFSEDNTILRNSDLLTFIRVLLKNQKQFFKHEIILSAREKDKFGLLPRKGKWHHFRDIPWRTCLRFEEHCQEMLLNKRSKEKKKNEEDELNPIFQK